MLKRDNPYTPGAGRKPPMLAGRASEIEEFAVLVERLSAGDYERSLIYTGLRGVGKTVLLMELDVLATETGWATTDVQEVGSQPDFRVTFARMAARLLRDISRRHRLRERVERALGVVKAFSVAGPAAGLPDLRVRLMSAKPYADRLFQYRELGSLSPAAARHAIVSPASTRGLEFDEAAVREVVAESAGYPYFLQEYGLELWNHTEASPVTVDDVAEVQAIVSDSLARVFFGTRFEMATDAEQRYLAAIASLGDPPYRTADAARAYGARDQRGVSMHRDSLIGKGLIWSPRRGQIDFTVPLFAQYLRETHPLSGFDDP